MSRIITIKKYIVFFLSPEEFKPFERVRGPITVEPVTLANVADVGRSFPAGKVPVLREKIERGDIGILARHGSDVVGYMWRRDYDTARPVKADGYIPLEGKFSHFHFARVSQEMRGRGIQLFMFTHLLRDTFAQGIERIYTDGEQENIVSMRGTMKMGFKEVFRLMVIEARGRKLPIKYLGNHRLGGNDSLRQILAGKWRLLRAGIRRRSGCEGDP